MRNRDSYDERFDRNKDLLEKMFAIRSSYHNHKETMAHAGFLFQAALFGSIINMDHWPPKWIEDVSVVYAPWIAFGGYLLLWMGIHFFIRWQLKNRRSAALECAAFLRTLRKWANKLPTDEELAPYKVIQKESMHSRNAKLKDIKTSILTILDYIIIIPNVEFRSDGGLIGYPVDFINEHTKQKDDSTQSIITERLLNYGSLFLLFMVFFRTFLKFI